MKKLALTAASIVLFASGQAQAGFGQHYKTLCPPPAVCQPAPKKKIWVAGHYETQLKQVWVPGHFEMTYVNPVYAQYPYFGHCTVKILVSPGSYKQVWIEGHFQSERCKVWVPGQWVLC